MSSAKKSVGKRPAKRKSVVNCCRACLATDVKLVHMLEHKLDEEFFRVTGIVVVEKDMLPLHLCVWCAAFLRSCAAFRSKCVRVNELILPLQGKLTIDSVRAMDRFANQLVNLTPTDIEVEGTDEKSSVPLDLKPIAMNNEKKELFVDIQSSYENEIKIHVKDEVKKTDLDNDEYHETFEDGFENTVFIEAKLENVSDKIHDTTQSVDTSMGIKGQKEVCYARRKRRKKPHSSRSAENDFLPAVDVEELKKTWNVDVEILTHEQQLAEIAERRDSAEYRQAQFPCDPCGRYFQVEKAYRNHMLKHDRKGQHKCPVCTIRFSLQCRMWRHLDTHRFKYVCRECGFVSRTRQQAVLHHSYHEGKMYTCQYCRKQFRKLSTYLGHVRRRHKTMHIACEMCGETFINNKGLSYHKACEHGVSLKKYRECKICSVTFVSEDALKKHQATGAQKEHALLSPCAQCGDNFDTADALKEHVDGEHPSCEECNTTFVDAESYDVHIARKHYGKGDPQAAWRKEANLHTMALGQEPPFRFRCRNPVTKDKKYTSCCEHCGKAFTNIGLLRLHLRKHTGETPYACEHCPKRFVTKQRIAAHMPVHTGEKPFKCEQCGAAFTNKCNLHRHVRNAHMTHTGEKPFTCEQCGVAFTDKCNMQRHVRNVHLGIRKNSVCDICGRVFSTKFAMLMHVRTVHNGEPWPKRAPRKKQTTIKHGQDEDIDTNVYP